MLVTQGIFKKSLVTQGVCKAFSNKKNVYTFDGVDDYISIPPWTPTGSFTIEVTFNTSSATLQSLVHGSSSAADCIAMDLTAIGDVRFFAYNGTSISGLTSTSSGAFNDGEDHTVLVTYDDTAHTITISVDGALLASNSYTNNDAQDIAYIGSRANVERYMAGIIKDVKLTCVTICTDNRHYAIDDGYTLLGTITESLNNASTLVVNGDFSNGTTSWGGSGTLSVTNGVLSVANGNAEQNTIYMEAGITYEVEFDMIATDTNNYSVVLFSSGYTNNTLIYNPPVGTTVLSITPTVTGNGYLGLRSPAGTTQFDNVSVTQLNTGTAVNFSEANWSIE